MQINDCVAHEYKIKEVYKKSRIMPCYYDHIKLLQNFGVFDDITKTELPETFLGIYPKIVQKWKIFPNHLIYTSEEQFILFYGERMSERMQKHIIKKELLRKIFLFTLDQFLTPYIFNVDFHAYRFLVSDTVQFTTENQFSALLFKVFFKLPLSKLQTEK